MKNSISKLICLFMMRCLPLSVSAQVESVRGPKKRTGNATTTVWQNQNSNLQGRSSNSNQQRVSSGISTDRLVDLGLSVYWAGYNVGANSPEEYGSYFAWGETHSKGSYDKDNSLTFAKQMGDIATKASYDAARAKWGGNWRMPTKAEFEELQNKCKWEWITYCGEKGYKITGPNGNAIFLPAAGWRDETLLRAGEYGYYWTSAPDESSNDSYYLYFSYRSHRMSDGRRYYGCSVRPVSSRY